MRIAWKISSPNGEFKESVFNDWFQLCAHLMKSKRVANFPITIDVVVVMD